MFSAFRGWLRATGWCVIPALLMSACEDAGNGPLAIAVAAETHGAVLFSDGLSTVPQLLSDHGLSSEGNVEAEAWWASWEVPGGEGTELRSEIYPLAARRLFPVLGLTGVGEVLGRNWTSIASAEALSFFLPSEEIQEFLAQAKTSHRDAVAALNHGNGESALVLSFAAADALWEFSPRQVATELIGKAREALGRKPEIGTYSQEELIRIRRLMYGASEALDAGDYPRAIRRAYYACQLLGASST